MEKTKGEMTVEILRRSIPANKGSFMKMLGVAVNVEYSMRTSMENEQAAGVFANRQEFEEWVYITLEQKRGRNVPGLYGNGTMITGRVLDYLRGRQIVTLNNITNVDTPGFKAQYVTLEEGPAHRIQNATKGPNPRNGIARAIGQTRVGVNTTRAESSQLDGNSVDMDQEQMELMRTVCKCQHMFSSINNGIGRLKSATRVF